jgi:hypothetical protein
MNPLEEEEMNTAQTNLSGWILKENAAGHVTTTRKKHKYPI